jgi:hypothetical protein
MESSIPARLPSRSFAKAGAHTRNRREDPPKTLNDTKTVKKISDDFGVISRV